MQITKKTILPKTTTNSHENFQRAFLYKVCKIFIFESFSALAFPDSQNRIINAVGDSLIKNIIDIEFSKSFLNTINVDFVQILG